MNARTLVLSAATLVLLAACGAPPQPPTPPPNSVRNRLLAEKHFKLGALDFGRRGGTGPLWSGLEQAIPAMLLTEVRALGRFSIYEGGNIRADQEALNENTASKLVDGYLNGTITSETPTQVCFDVRLANAVNHEVLFARTACTGLVPAPAGGGPTPTIAAPPLVTAGGLVVVPEPSMTPDREPIKRLADDLSRSIPQVSFGSVTSADGAIIFVDKGAKAGVLRGMVAYLVSTGDTVHDNSVHQQVSQYTSVDPSSLATASTPVIVGQLYIVSVEDAYSVGFLYSGDYALPHDTVFFK
jgi:hypothetical protein